MKKRLDIKRLILLNLPYVFAFYFVDKLASVFRLAPGTELVDKLTGGFANVGTAFANPLPSFNPIDLLIGVSAGALLKLAVFIKSKNRKKFRQGEEYGSARWGKPEDIKPYTDDDFYNNVILTQTEYLTMNSRPKDPKYARNKNILVIGGSGSGKTRFFVKPNLMQMHSSYCVTDPKGTILVECGKMLEKNGYVIKSLNTINFRKSMHYNPFAYIRSEKDILKLVNTIIVNTKGDGDKSGEDFWVKAEKLYYTALIGYIWYEAPEHEKNFAILSLCELIVGGKEGLQPVEKTIIDRSVRMVYQDYLADPVPEKMPILEDLYNVLRRQTEPEAQRIATALEIYVHGSLNVFNHRTNVNVNNRIVCYDIRELGKQLKKLGMLIVQDQVWNRVTINRAQHKATRYYMDEFHLLLKEEQTAAYSVEIWKRFRKWGGIPTGITQNVKDLLASREVENIFENSDFVYLLNQASGDRQILSKALNISPSQQNYITNSNAGEGLIFYGSTIVPFKDNFPKDSPQLLHIVSR